ncbi:MAG TPA: hypothetical protein PK225_07575 [Azonexus sp.]|jgi:hypothetical protein|nr:hypothetical protein [Azonexus sp.]
MSYPERIWVGQNYESLRVLVLGESWYGDYEGDLVTDAGYIAAYLANKQPDRMYTKMANATGLGKKKFWDSVAFTNFVQRVGATLDCRPTSQQYLDAQDRLRRLLSELVPKGVWILGTEQGAYSEPVVRAAGIACTVSPHPTRRGVTNAWLGEGWCKLMATLQADPRSHACTDAQPGDAADRQQPASPPVAGG